MFTGLIQSVGKAYLQGNSLRVEGYESFGPLQIGDSVAVDGVCLTVVECSSTSFYADVSEETLDRTTLGSKAKKNDFVNLEPALRFSDRIGGHLVSGHVDDLGEVRAINKLNQSWILELFWRNLSYGKYICAKGSICVNGISLTVAESLNNGKAFSIAVIPHTWTSTSLQHLSIGDSVNLEADLMAKYAEQLLNKSDIHQNPSSDISASWLKSQGWR